MSRFRLVINLGRSYSGIEVHEGSGFEPTRISIPFDTYLAAFAAAGELDARVEETNPVIAGSVIGDNDHDQDEDGRALPDGSAGADGGGRLLIERQQRG
jgi:hypothetical protein